MPGNNFLDRRLGLPTFTASSDNSDGGVPLFTPISERFNITSSTANNVDGNSRNSIATSQADVRVAGTKPKKSVAEGREKSVGFTGTSSRSESPANAPKQQNSGSSKLNPNTEPFLPSSRADRNPKKETTERLIEKIKDTMASTARVYRQNSGKLAARQPPVNDSKPYNGRASTYQHQTPDVRTPDHQLGIPSPIGSFGRDGGNVVPVSNSSSSSMPGPSQSYSAGLQIQKNSNALDFAHAGTYHAYQQSTTYVAGSHTPIDRVDPDRVGLYTNEVGTNAARNGHPERNGRSPDDINQAGGSNPQSQVFNSAAKTMSDYNHFALKSTMAVQPLLLNAPVALSANVLEAPSKALKAQRSSMLNRIAGADGIPKLACLMKPDNFPFVEPAQYCDDAEHGVVHLKNIPYGATQPEIIAFLGRNSKMLNDKQEPVHIIMDRVSSKTNDAYVEFLTLDDAVNTVDRHNGNNAKGRVARLGDRPIEVELSSQSQLMADLFPVATGVTWHGSRPEIQPMNPREPWTNFKTFVTDEEMTMLIKHVEVPNRSPFSRDCPERAYESLISTIKKMPWYMTEYITIKQRYSIYEAACRLISALKTAIRNGNHEDRLTPQLLKRIVTATMICPGFTVVQKDNIADMTSMSDDDKRKFNMPDHADLWRHQYTLGPKANIPKDVLEYYIAIIRQETNDAVSELSIREKQNVTALGKSTSDYWGFFWREVGYPGGPAFDNMTLAQAATLEWAAMDRILRHAIARATARVGLVNNGGPSSSYVTYAAHGVHRAHGANTGLLTYHQT